MGNKQLSRHSLFELGLIQLVERMEGHPGSPTKEGANQYRLSVQFNVTLKRSLEAAQANNEAYTMQSFYGVARQHFAAVFERRRTRQDVGRSSFKVRILFAALQGVLRRRKANALSSWLSYSQAVGPSASIAGSDGDEPDIFTALLVSQCETAVALEERVRLANRAGGLALCMAGLQRSRLRSSWTNWCQMLPIDDGSLAVEPRERERRQAPASVFSGAASRSGAPMLSRGAVGGSAGPVPRTRQQTPLPRGFGETQQLTQLIESLR